MIFYYICLFFLAVWWLSTVEGPTTCSNCDADLIDVGYDGGVRCPNGCDL